MGQLYFSNVRNAMAKWARRRILGGVAVLTVAGALGAAGCGVGVAKGGENAATHPGLGIFVSPTVGAGNISGSPAPTALYQPPPVSAPSAPPPGSEAAIAAIEAAVKGGCWEDSHQANLYGAYDQLFWWQGNCGDTVTMVDAELYPSATAAASAAHHPTDTALLERYLDGAVLVDVYGNAPPSVLTQLSTVKGLRPVPGYGV
jgi:hypothetical protein